MWEEPWTSLVETALLKRYTGWEQMENWEGNYGLLFSAWRTEGICDQFHSFREASLCARYVLVPGDTTRTKALPFSGG